MSIQSRVEIREALLNVLTDVEGVERREIDDAISSVGGDQLYELESKTAEAVLAVLSSHFGVPLPGPSDLDPEQFATVEALVGLVETKLADLDWGAA